MRRSRRSCARARSGSPTSGVKGSGGTAIFSVSGHVEKPGNYELPLGIPFKDLLEIAGGVRGGRKLKAVIPGGSSVPVVPAEAMMGLTWTSTRCARPAALGTGATVVMDETTCMVRAAAPHLALLHAESCGQCTPCREGTGWMHRVLKRIIDGQGHAGRSRHARRRREQDRRPHDLRARRCRGVAGAELPEAFPARVRVHGRARRSQHRRELSAARV
jgi:NADH:ubiquinone oxidoreductase subunit F (NADH-binding)